MARLVKLTKVKKYDDPEKDVEVYVNPEQVQSLEVDIFNIVEIAMHGYFVRVRGDVDEIIEKLSLNNNRRIY